MNNVPTMDNYASDTFILDVIKSGIKFDLIERTYQHCCNNFPLLKEEMSIINSDIQKFESKNVIVNTDKKQKFHFSCIYQK